MELTILPTKKIINTARAQYKRYSLPDAEPVPTEINRLSFFYIGSQTRNIQKLKEHFEFGYTSVSVESAIFTVKRLLKKQDADVTIPDMIIAEGTLGTEQLVELHKFIYGHKIMAEVPFIVEATGLSKEALARFKRYVFIDELLFLPEFTAPELQHKVNFLKTMKQKWVRQPQANRVETSFRRFPDVRALFKRTLDIAIASVLLVTLAPLLLLIALIVKIDTGGPVLYTTQRTGRGYRIFNLYKFNTIIQDADKRKTGATISKTGLFIRKAGLDELPQLLNVWLGDLSLAGPRALPMYEASRLTTNTCANNFMATPGISFGTAGENGKLVLPADAPMADTTDKSDLLYDIWLMANKPPAIIHKSNA